MATEGWVAVYGDDDSIMVVPRVEDDARQFRENIQGWADEVLERWFLQRQQQQREE